MSNTTTATVEIVKTATEYAVLSNGTQVGKITARKVGNRVVGYTWVPALGKGCPITVREGDDRGGFKLHTLKTALIAIKAIATKAAEAAAAQPVAEVAPVAFDPAAPSATKFAVESLCKFAVARGCLLSLSNNSEGIVIEPTDDVAAVLAALAEIGDVCMLTIKRRNPQSAMLSGLDNAGAAWVLPNDGDVCQTDTVSDYSDAPLIEEWAEAFDRRTYN
jgi:hypothetical protein